MKHIYTLFLALFSVGIMHAQQPDVLRVMSYNLLNYRNTTSYCPVSKNNPSAKEAHLQTIVQHVLPDVIVCNEIGDSPTNADLLLLNALNKNGINYYQKADYTNNSFSSLVNMLFYNSNKLGLHSQSSISKDINGNNLVRVIDFYRLYYKDSLLTAQSDTVFFTVVAAHLKAGNTGSDISDRAAATEAAMEHIYYQIPDDNVLFCGDLNIYKSQEAAYQNLTQGSITANRLYDPVNSPGNWSNNGSFASLHTQSTRSSNTNGGCFSSGGLDDRLDHILISDEVRDNLDGMGYVNNTYAAIGNDGLHFNKDITDATNASVPAAVLAALHGLSDHLPVVADFEIERQQIGIFENEKLAANTTINNPVTNQMAVQIKAPWASGMYAEVYSASGQLIEQIELTKNGTVWHATVSTTNWAKGVYMVHIQTENGGQTIQKVIKL